MTRRPDAAARLSDYLIAVHDRRVDWRVWHCLAFASGAVAAVTGAPLWADPVAIDGGHDAARRLRAAGFRTVADAVAAVLPEVPRLRAGVGDVVEIVPASGVGALGIYCGGLVYVCGRGGVGVCGLDRAGRIFGVGEWQRLQSPH